MASSSSSCPSASANSLPSQPSQPLHNFELPPLLRWNSSKRFRSMKPPLPPHRRHFLPAYPLRRSPPRVEPPLRDFAAVAPPRRLETHLVQEARVPPPAAADYDLERPSLFREESPRHYPLREWWSSPERSDVIAYRRNPMKKSAFSTAKFGGGSSSSAAAEIKKSGCPVDEVYQPRNPYLEKSRLPCTFVPNSEVERKSATGEGEAVDRNLVKKSAFTFNSKAEEGGSYRTKPQRPFKRSAFLPPLPPPPSSSSKEKKVDAAFLKEVDASYSKPHFQHKQPFSSNFDDKMAIFLQGDASPKFDHSIKKSAFHSPKKHAFSSRSEEKKKAIVAEANYPKIKIPWKKSAFAPPNSEEKKPKMVAEGHDAYPKSAFKKSVYASELWKQATSSSPEEKLKLERKPKVSESEAKEGHASPEKKPALPSPMEEGRIEKNKCKEEAQAKGVKPKILFKKSASTAPPKKTKLASSSSNTAKAAPPPPPPPQTLKIANSRKGKEIAEDQNPKKDNEEAEEEEVKVWNLRPRNVTKGKPDAQPGGSGGGGVEKMENKKLSIQISLTKEEIEADFLALTGAKPSRRPKKRPKNVQKELDTLFPGLWLLSITPDTYKVSESSHKG